MRLVLLALLLIKQIAVHDILPDGEEAAREGRDRREEGVAEPDDKDIVLLTEGLAAHDLLVVAHTDAASDPELRHARHESNQRDEHLVDHRRGVVHQALRRHDDRERQRADPKIEGGVLRLGAEAVELRQELLHGQRGKERQNQHGEDARTDHPEGGQERDPLLRVDERQHERCEDRHHEVDQQRVGRYRGGTTSEFYGEDHGGGCRRAEEAEHGALDQDARGVVAHDEQHGCKEREEAHLNEHRPPEPPLQTQIAHANLAEREEEHQEEQRRLDKSHRLLGQAIGAIGPRQRREDKVGGRPDHHGDRQGPLAQKIDEFVHGAKVRKKGEIIRCKWKFDDSM